MEKDEKKSIDIDRIRKSIQKRIFQIVKPMPAIGGLSLSDSSIKYFEFRGGKERSVSLRLPPGIIVSGKIRDRENLIAALKAIHLEVSKGKKNTMQVVLTLPTSDVYAQTFTMPSVSEQGTEEAASLNLQMISPLDIKTAYYGWQTIGEQEGNRKQLEVLGAFVPKDVVDPIVTALQEADYGVVAVEFSSLSLVRSVHALGMFSEDVPYVVLEVSAEGLDLIITKNGGLYFDYFYPWSFIQGSEQGITIEKLGEVIESEVRKMLHFYVGHWGSQIGDIIVVAPSMWRRLHDIVRERFPQLNVDVVVPRKVGSSHGAALRGLTPRSEDTDISLTTVSAKRVFERDQIVRFVVGWRRLLAIVFGFMLALFIFVDIFLGTFSTEGDGPITTGGAEMRSVEEVKAKVQEFNSMVALVRNAKVNDNTISPLFILLSELGGSSVQYDKIHFPGVGKQMVIEGTVRKEADVIDFKNKIEGVVQFTDIDLPYSSIIAMKDGRFSFTLRATVTSLDFSQRAQTTSEGGSEGDRLEATITEQLETISSATGDLLRFDNIDFVSSSKPITVTGNAASIDIVYLLRDQLIASPSFKDVFLFSNDIKERPDGRVSFSIQFRVVN